MHNTYDDSIIKVYLGSTPKLFNAPGRNDDLELVVHGIKTAERYIHISLADYMPMKLFGKRGKSDWTVIDDLLREGKVCKPIEWEVPQTRNLEV